MEKDCGTDKENKPNGESKYRGARARVVRDAKNARPCNGWAVCSETVIKSQGTAHCFCIGKTPDLEKTCNSDYEKKQKGKKNGILCSIQGK